MRTAVPENETISWLVVDHRPAGTGVDDDQPVGRPLPRLLPHAVKFSVLGQLEVFHKGERLILGGHRQRAVLAVLIMESGGAVSVDRLVDALWGDAPPPGARATIHAYVSKLRRIVHPECRMVPIVGGLLATRGCGYVLDVEAEAVDARRFERLGSEGRVALAAGKPEMAADLLSEALALWRGPALADFAFDAFAAPEIARLDQLRLTVNEDHAEAALALGRHRTVVANLERLVATHPFRERLRAHLMVALYRCGRQAEALQIYQAGRRLLREELGIGPSPALKTLEGAILRQDRSLEWMPDEHRVPNWDTAERAAGHAEHDTVTFLGSEIQSVNRLWAEHRAQAAAMMARHREVVTQVVLGYRGRLSYTGEPGSVVGVFSGAGGALAAALSLRRVLAAEPWPEGTAVQVRIGLSTRDLGRHANPNGPGLCVRSLAQKRKFGVAGARAV